MAALPDNIIISLAGNLSLTDRHTFALRVPRVGNLLNKPSQPLSYQVRLRFTRSDLRINTFRVHTRLVLMEAVEMDLMRHNPPAGHTFHSDGFRYTGTWSSGVEGGYRANHQVCLSYEGRDILSGEYASIQVYGSISIQRPTWVMNRPQIRRGSKTIRLTVEEFWQA